MDVHCASLGDWLPWASGYALPITRLMSDALSRLQKFAGTCTPAAFGAEPPSWEHPHATDKITAIATHNSTQRLTGLSERDTAVGIVQSLQHREYVAQSEKSELLARMRLVDNVVKARAVGHRADVIDELRVGYQRHTELGSRAPVAPRGTVFVADHQRSLPVDRV